MKKFRLIGIAVILAITVCVLIFAGSADPSTAADMEARAIAVYNGLIGAENTRLALGGYESDTGTTGQLSESELKKQIDDYNAQVDLYYATDNPCYATYQEWNEFMLRNDFSDTVFYRQDGGVLDYDVRKLTYNDDETEATVKLTLISYNTWIEETETGRFEIRCCVGAVDLTALMVQENNDWKLLRHEEYIKLDDWIPQDSLLDDSSSKIALYAMPEERLAAAKKVAALTTTEYDNFESAKNAASQIKIEEICPFTVE